MLGIGDRLLPFQLKGINNRVYVPEVFEEADHLVIIFWSNKCPTVAAYEKRILAMVRDFESLGFRFLAVNSNGGKDVEESLEEMMRVAKSRNYNFAYVTDENAQFAKAMNAVCTPEAFVFDRERRLVYRGAIDDNWKDPHLVRHRYLRGALTELSKKVPLYFVPETKAQGCAIKGIM